MLQRLFHRRISVPVFFLAASHRHKLVLNSRSSIDRFMSSTTSVAATQQPTYDWCCTASIEPETKEITIEHVTGYGKDTAFRSVDDQRFDVTTSPDWMEFIERSEKRLGDEGGAGAYDTLRCDMILQQQESTADRWRIWGEDFHLNRLQNSFASLKIDGGKTHGTAEEDDAVKSALATSRSLLRALLSEAEASDLLHSSISDSSAWQDIEIQLLRLTFLWSPSQAPGSHDIIVRGHACCFAKPMQVHRPVDPIHVTIAALAHKGDNVTVDETIPTRFRDPQNKVASWTRLRKKMERPETYKPPGVSEVLMVRPERDSNDLEVLEGLSSNLMVIYKDGTIRTAQDGVLFGYVRHLVLECAEECGLTLDPKPVLLHESDQWHEAFITSSSRLIYPIGRMLIHNEDDQTVFTEHWRDVALTDSTCPATKPKWRRILDEILRRGGYPMLNAN